LQLSEKITLTKQDYERSDFKQPTMLRALHKSSMDILHQRVKRINNYLLLINISPFRGHSLEPVPKLHAREKFRIQTHFDQTFKLKVKSKSSDMKTFKLKQSADAIKTVTVKQNPKSR